MCKIDAAFAGKFLNEQSNPAERFEQALNESSLSGHFRVLLTKHFASSWQEELGDIALIESALEAVRNCDNDFDRLSVFIKHGSLDWKFRLSLSHIRESNSKIFHPTLFGFVKDAARSFCGDSPFSLYESKLGEKIGVGNFQLIEHLFGDDCFTKDFFNTPELTELSTETRIEKLWRFFCDLANQGEQNYLREPNEINLTENELLALVNAYSLEGPPTKQAYLFRKGLVFLEAWLKHEAELGCVQNWSDHIFWKTNELFSQFKSLASTFELDENKVRLGEWVENYKKSLDKHFYLNFSISDTSDDKAKQWAEGLERHYDRFAPNWFELEQLPLEQKEEFREKLKVNKRLYLEELVNQLSPIQLEIWIRFTIAKDFEDVQTASALEKQCKWCYGETYPYWKEEFFKSLQALNIEQQVIVLSCTAPFPRFPDHVNADEVSAFYREHKLWWSSLLLGLVERADFPKYLLPTWTIAARDYRSVSDLLSYIDNSIGFLRGELNKEGITESRLLSYQEQLKKLLGWLDNDNQQKSLRHRLMLMRSSTVPLADQGLNYRRGHTESQWYVPLKELAENYSRVVCNSISPSKTVEALESFYFSLSNQLAEFYVSRLRLRKGEKAINGQYDSAQVVEPSTVWRQGYLKALAEIGFDLKGQVHKTVNFIKQSDPDPDVRAVAKETYKVVRRQSSPTRTVEDLKRGIIAAEWWLLLCQRQELEETIDHEAAIKTRRRLLRNP